MSFCCTRDEVEEAIMRWRRNALNDRETMMGIQAWALHASEPKEKKRAEADIAHFASAIWRQENDAKEAEALLQVNFYTVFEELRQIRRSHWLTFIEREKVTSWLQIGFCACVGTHEVARLQETRLLHMASMYPPPRRYRRLAA